MKTTVNDSGQNNYWFHLKALMLILSKDRRRRSQWELRQFCGEHHSSRPAGKGVQLRRLKAQSSGYQQDSYFNGDQRRNKRAQCRSVQHFLKRPEWPRRTGLRTKEKEISLKKIPDVRIQLTVKPWSRGSEYTVTWKWQWPQQDTSWRTERKYSNLKDIILRQERERTMPEKVLKSLPAQTVWLCTGASVATQQVLDDPWDEGLSQDCEEKMHAYSSTDVPNQEIPLECIKVVPTVPLSCNENHLPDKGLKLYILKTMNIRKGTKYRNLYLLQLTVKASGPPTFITSSNVRSKGSLWELRVQQTVCLVCWSEQ